MVLRKITCIGAKETRIAHNTHVILTNTIDQDLNIPRLLRGLEERDRYSLDIGHVRLMYPIGHMRQYEVHGAYCSYTKLFMRPRLTRSRLAHAPAATVNADAL